MANRAQLVAESDCNQMFVVGPHSPHVVKWDAWLANHILVEVCIPVPGGTIVSQVVYDRATGKTTVNRQHTGKRYRAFDSAQNKMIDMEAWGWAFFDAYPEFNLIVQPGND